MRLFHSFHDPELLKMLQTGAVGVMPTDTVYGLVAPANNEQAVERMYALKDRFQKPGTTIAASAEQLIDLGLDAESVQKVAYLWPAPLSIVMSIAEPLAYITQGVGESPFRVVADEKLRMFLEQSGPLVTSSANAPGEPTAQNLAEAQGYFADRVDFYVDGGHIGERPPSTIARLEGNKLTVLRQGAAKVEQGEIA